MDIFSQYKVTITMDVVCRADGDTPSPKHINEKVCHAIKTYSDNLLVGRTVVEITGVKK